MALIFVMKNEGKSAKCFQSLSITLIFFLFHACKLLPKNRIMINLALSITAVFYIPENFTKSQILQNQEIR